MEINIAKEAVKRAANLANKVAKNKISSVTKQDKSPVTIADFGAQALVISCIKKAFPHDNIIGEEDSDALRTDTELANKVYEYVKQESSPTEFPNIEKMFETIDFGKSKGGSKGRYWALDPIDGTKGFLRGGQYAVCLGLVIDSIVEIGVIACPNLGETGGIFWATRGKGAAWEPLWGDLAGFPQKLSVRKNYDPATAKFCEGVESGHSNLELQEQIAKVLGITLAPIQMDSQAKYCIVARGDADAYLRLPRVYGYKEKVWDHAAGALIATEAGAIVSDMHGKGLDFGQGRTLVNNQGIVVSNSAIHDKIISEIASRNT